MVRIRFFSIMAALGIALLLVLPGCDELITENITEIRYGLPIAEFEISGADSGCLNDTSNTFNVVFEDQSQGRPIQWEWNFGDSVDNPDSFKTIIINSDINNTENNGNTEHNYRSTGAFTVSLTVYDTLDGPDSEIKRRAVIVGQSRDSVTISADSICPGELATLTVHRPFGVLTWNWDFGDGTSSPDSDPVQTHSWTNHGTDTVVVTLTGACGSTSDTIVVTIMDCAQPSFTADPKGGCAPLEVEFVNETIDSIYDTSGAVVSIIEYWEYNFGDGQAFSTDREPTTTSHTYSTADVYEVSLTVRTDLLGVTTHYDTIVVLPGLADFSFTAAPTAECKSSPSERMWVAFKRESTGDDRWLWDFGDGITSTLQNPYHAYTEAGEYTVTLTAYGVCDPTDTVISILPTPIIFSDTLADTVLFSVIDYQEGDTTDGVDSSLWYTFTDTSAPATVVNWIWDFGDGTTSTTGPSIMHEYVFSDSAGDTARSYEVVLTRFNGCDSIGAYDSVHVAATTTK